METAWRLFLALTPPEEVVQALVAVQRQLRDRLPERAVRWLPAAQLHLTLRFLGNVAPGKVQALLDACGAVAARAVPLDLRAAELGCFPHPRAPRIVWAGLEGDLDGLARLQRELACAAGPFGEARDDKPFQPHLTLGRVPSQDSARLRGLGAAVIYLPRPHLGRWTARGLELVRSELRPDGARYTRIAELPLGGPTSGTSTGVRATNA